MGRQIARPRGPKPSRRIRLTAPEYRELKRTSRLRSAPYAEVVRARILLRAYEHPDWSNVAIARAWVVPTGPCASGAVGAGRGRRIRKLRGPGGPRFLPSAVRARVTALACTLPRDSGKPLSRWSAGELARAVIQRGIVSNISASTVKRWFRAEQIKPWPYRSGQQTTDPRFLEKAIPILELYERAHELS
jgi:hypothetical protein